MRLFLFAVALAVASWGCSSDDSSAGGTDSGSSLADAGAGLDAGGSPADSGSSGSDGGALTVEQVRDWVTAYHDAHPGSSGDINALTPAQVAADPDAQRLLALCGDDQRPVIPILAWEYGGLDHAWINPMASALVYCVYIPVAPSTAHWMYDAVADHVTAHVYVLFPETNPCADRVGADQVAGCIGDPSNFEILVDTASLNDGAGAGLSLSEASTELWLMLVDGTTVHLYDGI